MESKRTQAIQKFNYWATRMICPICQSNLSFTNNQVRCDHNHSFDIAKQGYINLAPNHQEAHYNNELFAARQRIMGDAKLYTGIYDQILDLLVEQGIDLNSVNNIIDLGTGEGSHFHYFIDHWQNRTQQTTIPMALGLDLAKDGIVSAAKHYTNALWVVADLGQLPFTPASIDGAITILSPSNYHHLNQALSEKGWFIKVIPGPNYLRELREIVLTSENQQQDDRTSINKFKAAFNQFSQSSYRKTVTLDEKQMADLIKMTPLMWHANDKQLERAHALTQITIDLSILFGQKE